MADILWEPGHKGFRLLLDQTKTGRTGVGVYISYRDYGGVNAVSLMRQWFDMMNLWRKHQSLVFPATTRGGSLDFSKSPSGSWFRSKVKKACTSVGLAAAHYSGHSFRAGGATDLFVARVPYYIIKKKGRWISDAALIYYRDEDDVDDAVEKAFRILVVKRENKGDGGI